MSTPPVSTATFVLSPPFLAISTTLAYPFPSHFTQMLDAFGRMLTDHSDDEAGVIAILRFLTGLVNQLSTDSVLASFWIGIAGENNSEPTLFNSLSDSKLLLQSSKSVPSISSSHWTS